MHAKSRPHGARDTAQWTRAGPSVVAVGGLGRGEPGLLACRQKHVSFWSGCPPGLPSLCARTGPGAHHPPAGRVLRSHSPQHCPAMASDGAAASVAAAVPSSADGETTPPRRKKIVAPQKYLDVQDDIARQMKAAAAEMAQLNHKKRLASRRGASFRRKCNKLSMEDVAMIAECRGLTKELQQKTAAGSGQPPEVVPPVPAAAGKTTAKDVQAALVPTEGSAAAADEPLDKSAASEGESEHSRSQSAKPEDDVAV